MENATTIEQVQNLLTKRTSIRLQALQLHRANPHMTLHGERTELDDFEDAVMSIDDAVVKIASSTFGDRTLFHQIVDLYRAANQEDSNNKLGPISPFGWHELSKLAAQR